MKPLIPILIILAAVLGLSFKKAEVACRPAEDGTCLACKDCSKCKHCQANGGKCSVCLSKPKK